MKKVSLFLMLTMIITVFTACNDTKEQDQDSKDYILVGNHSPIKSSFGMLINGGGQENGQFPYMLVLGGGVDVTEYLSLAEGLVANAPNDMSLLMLFVSSSSPNSIPSGTYTYKERSEERRVGKEC